MLMPISSKYWELNITINIFDHDVSGIVDIYLVFSRDEKD